MESSGCCRPAPRVFPASGGRIGRRLLGGKGHRGDGDGEEPGKASKSVGKARPKPTDHQLQYTGVGHGGFIVGGRRGIVEDVTLKDTSEDSTHLLCIAEIELSSSFCQILSFRVAGCSLLRTRGDGDGDDAWVRFYNELGNRLKKKAVRLLAGELLDHTGAFLRQMREQFCINVAAWLPYKQEDDTVHVSSSYIFVLGKVQTLQLAYTEHKKWERKDPSRGNGSQALPTRRAYVGEPFAPTPLERLSWPALPEELKNHFPQKPAEFFAHRMVQRRRGHGEDASRGWPVIPRVNQKAVKHTEWFTEKRCIYLGSRTSRRSEGKEKERNFKRKERANHWGGKGKTWAIPFMD